MCASHTDITGSPVANAVAGDGYRAGSHYGGYSGGTYYGSGYQTTASPQRVYDSEFSQPSSGTQPTGARTIQTSPNTTSFNAPGRNQVVPANYYAYGN